MKVSEVVWDALVKPMEIFIKDPAVAFTNIYVSRHSSFSKYRIINDFTDFSHLRDLLLLLRGILLNLASISNK